MSDKKDMLTPDPSLVHDIRRMIEEARESVAVAVNAGLTMLYWRIGRRIRQDVLKGERAEYGEDIVSALSGQLEDDYGRGFSVKNLRHMIRFAEVFADEAIVSTLWRQMGWSHFKEIIYKKDPLQRDFYAEMCRIERWSVRTLRQKIDSMLYERTAISKKPEELIRHEIDSLRNEDQLTPDLVFRDPYFLDFLGLTDRYLEKDLEDAILRELELFLLELGAGFSFVARQKRIQVDNDDYYLDLLFFHRKLKRLVAIELKLGDFKPNVLMLEPKASNQMDDAIVLAKKEAAMKWCANASNHALSYGGKPWQYVLIPHHEIAENMTLDGLVSRFSQR